MASPTHTTALGRASHMSYPAIRAADGEILTEAIDIFSLRCVHCGETISDASIPFVALGKPYYGLIHRPCIHMFAFDNEWPHGAPAGSFFGHQHGHGDRHSGSHLAAIDRRH
jgi:hypothetical protein